MKIVSVKGATVVTEWLSLPGGAAIDAVSATRSAALIMLSEASSHSGRPSPLDVALRKEPGGYDNLLDATWHEKNIARFIVRTTLGPRQNVDVNLVDVWEKAEEAGGDKVLRVAWKQGHHYRLEVVLTDTDWLAHVKKGDEFGTTAFDVWTKDPAVTMGEPTKASAKKTPPSSGGWTRKTRQKVAGSRTPHPLDPKPPTLEKDWQQIASALREVTVPEIATTALRALDVSRVPDTLDAAVERARLAMLPSEDPVQGALVRTWWRIGGAAFVWSVFGGSSESFETTVAVKGGGSEIGNVRFDPQKRLRQGHTRLSFWTTLRWLGFSLPEGDFAAVHQGVA